MISKDDIASAIYDAKYGSLSAFAKDRIDHIYRESNGIIVEHQTPVFHQVDVNEKTAKQLQEENDALTDENRELWEENEQLKIDLHEARSANANRDSWNAGQQQDEFSDESDSEV